MEQTQEVVKWSRSRVPVYLSLPTHRWQELRENLAKPCTSVIILSAGDPRLQPVGDRQQRKLAYRVYLVEGRERK